MNLSKLIFLNDNYKGIGITLDKTLMSCGRSNNADIKIIDNTISSIHCYFQIDENNNVLIKDNNSTNGIFINNIKVKEQILNCGDIIQIGSVEILFRDNNNIKTTINKTNIYIPENIQTKSLNTLTNLSPFKKNNKRTKIIKKIFYWIFLILITILIVLFLSILLYYYFTFKF